MSPDASNWSFFSEHREEILSATLDHMTLVVIAMGIAILIAVPLGMFIVQRPAPRAIALGIANIFQTIPSLALFGFRALPDSVYWRHREAHGHRCAGPLRAAADSSQHLCRTLGD